ncbi:hypothetical protein [Staphylococcus intermedius]|uniref:hypothetical protein n=1 Tax=Staphylococcus intermedius TaxID=1285 RepID=UPI00142D5995|nr:hypothetical protein [Staphylococcus intermedius]
MKNKSKSLKFTTKISMTTAFILGGLSFANCSNSIDKYLNSSLSHQKVIVASLNLISSFKDQNAYAIAGNTTHWSQKKCNTIHTKSYRRRRRF